LRQDGQDETEFVTVNLFESLAAVKAFAGPDYEVPVFDPEARRLLSKVEPIARHYDVKKLLKCKHLLETPLQHISLFIPAVYIPVYGKQEDGVLRYKLPIVFKKGDKLWRL
jgi:hypothetical protein